MVSPFLEQIAQEILKQNNPQKITVVLPSKRSIVFLKHFLSQHIDKPIWLPKIYSIEDFITKLSGLQILDNLSLQFRLYEIFDANRPSDNEDQFEQFLKWSQTILYDFNEMDRYLVDVKSLLTNLRDIKELEQWSLNSAELTPFQEKYVQFFAHLYHWYSEFTQSLLKDNLAYQGLAYRQAAHSIQSQNHQFEALWFVGLNALTTAENQIINHYVQHHNARLFWDADAHYVNNPIHEAGFFLRQHINQWGSVPLSNFFEQEKHIEIIGCAKSIGQTRVAGNILHHFTKEDLKNSQTALVLADENLLFPMLNNLPHTANEVNITMGAPIRSTPLFSLIDLLFKLHLRKEQYAQQKFHSKELYYLLRHPYMGRLLDKVERHNLLQFLNTEKTIFIDSLTLKKQLISTDSWDILGPLLAHWNSAEISIYNIKQLLNVLKDKILKEEASVESEILFSIYQSIQILENHISTVSAAMDLKTLKAIFYHIIAKESISFFGEPLNGLQMMGVLETRTLDFKNLIILSVNEEKLPAGKSVNSFIPYVLKKHFKMPTHEERDAIFAYHFYRLIQRSESIHLLYNTQTDEFGSGEKSRFITQLLNEYKQAHIHQSVLQSEGASLEGIHPIIIPKTAEVVQLIKDWATHKVSPTSLSTYVNCQLQFYFKYIAKINPQEDIVEFMEASSFGSIIHDALHKAYLPYLNQNISLDLLSTIEEECIKFIALGFQKEVGQRMHHGKNHLMWQVAKRLTSNYFNKEKEFITDSTESLKLRDTEQSLQYSMCINGQDFELFGNVDRVDQIGHNVRIIDYKTGMVEQSDLTFKEFSELIKSPKKSKALQLMTYALLYTKSFQNDDVFFTAGNYSFRNLDQGVLFITKDQSILKWNRLTLNEFEDQIKLLLTDIMDTQLDFKATEDLDSCKWCDFKRVCGR